MLPLAHAGHYAVWALYLLPVILVILGVLKTTLRNRRNKDAPPGGGREGDPRTDTPARPQDPPP